MASVGTVVIEVDADVAKFVEGIQQTNKKISSLESRAREAKKTIANFASAVVGIYAVGEAFSIAKQQAGEFLKTASDFEQYENRLSAFYKGQGEVNGEITRAIDFSQKYNMSINDTMDSMIKMKVFGIDPTNKALEIFGNTAVGGGKSLDQFVEAMADAFQGENERLKEFGVKASVAGKKVQYAWSDSAGKSRNVVIDANKDIIQSTLETIFNEKYVGQMQLRADSWAGFIDGMKTDYTVFQKQVMDAGVFTYIKALTASFSQEWTSAIGDTTDSAKMFSEFMQDSIKTSIKAVAFFIDSWTGVKMVWAGLKVVWWGLVNGFQNAINWTADKWDGMTVGMHNAFKSFIDGAGTAWSSFINFFIKGINTSINAVAGLGNDMLDLMGIDPIKPINISLSEYESSIETAHKSTHKFLNTDYTGSALVDAMVDVQTNYDKLKNNSAQQFVENVLSKVEGEQKKIIKNEDELNKKRKDAKKALDDLMKTNEGTLQTAKKLNVAKAKGNSLAKEAKRLAKEHNKALKQQRNIELSIVEENAKKQLETDTKRAEAERLYQELLGNKAYAENIKYWELKNKLQEGGINLSIQQIKMIERQTKAQEALTNATKGWIDALVGGVLAGNDLGDVLHNAMGGLNKSITDSFSKSISDSIMESVKTGKISDFGIFDKSGNLTSVGKNGAMALGSLFVKSAFGDNKNAQRGAEFGQAVGFALGGVTGAIGGQIGGAILGSMMGGKVSYYTRVNEDGTVEAHRRKSGGLFHSSSDKILETETSQLQTAFDQTVKTYENLLESLFKINNKIEVVAGKYNTGDLLNKIIPQDVIDSWTGASVTQSQIDHLKNLIDERNQIRNEISSRGWSENYDAKWLGDAEKAVDDYVKYMHVSLDSIREMYTSSGAIKLSDLQQEARKKSNEIRKAWEAYAKLKDKSFNEVFVESLQQLQQTSINVFETLYRNDKIKVLEERAKRYKKAFDDVHKTIYGELYSGKSDRRQYMPTNKVPNQVTLENYDIMRERAIGKGATPEQVEAWNRLGQILIEDAKNADALKNAIDAKRKAEEEFKKSIAVSVRSFEDWVGTFNKSDLDKALYNRTRAEEDYKKALEEVGLKSTSTTQILELLNGANKDNLDDYQHLADAYRNNQEAQLAYNNILADSKKGVDTVIKSTKDLKALMDSFKDISTNWKDYNATLGVDELGKVNYQIQQTSHNLGLAGVTFENFGNLLNGIKTDVEDGKINNDELKNWSELSRLIQQQHNLRLQNLKDERAEILKNRDAIRSSMESIINTKISSIKTDVSNRTSSISSLQNSMNSYMPTKTVYSHDIYNAIGNWSYDKNKEIESSIKRWHDQQIQALKDSDKAGRDAWKDRKKRLQDEENLRVKNENTRIDSLNEQIKLSNQLADTINSMKKSVSKTFAELYGTTESVKTSLYNALNSKKYEDVSSLFSSYAKKVQDSNLTDTQAYIKIAYANRDIQNVVAPTKRSELKHIEARTIEIADYTSTLKDDSKKINEATVTMYEALIKQNKDHLPNLKDEVSKIFEQSKKYFDENSDFYKFLERGATELTFTEKMEEQKKLWEKYQTDAEEFNNKKLGALEKIDLSFNRYARNNLAKVNNNENSIKKLESKLESLHKEQQESNKLNKQIVSSLEKQLQEQKNINRNTKKSVIEVE